MIKRHHPALASPQQGASIVEALIAILIFSIGVLGIVGMQANMVQNTSESRNRADASYIIQQEVGKLWANSNLIPAQGGHINPVVSDRLPNGQLVIARGTIATGTDTLYTITITWQEPGKEQHRLVTTAVIAGN